MGSSSWTYFIPYRPDVASAIRDYQQEMFLAGEYYTPSVDGPDGRGMTTLAELWANEDLTDAGGTHSLLDIRRIHTDVQPGLLDDPSLSPEPCLAPLPDDRRQEVLGGGSPDRAVVRGLLARRPPPPWAGLPRGIGLYLVTYDADMPVEIAVWGRSGD